MNERANEAIPDRFEDFVVDLLDKEMPVAEAIGYLAQFHGVTDERIRDCFLNLNRADPSDKAKIGKSIRNGSACFKIQTFDSDGGWKSNSLISKEGQPMASHG